MNHLLYIDRHFFLYMPHQHFCFLHHVMATTQYFNNHTLIDFEKLSIGDSNEINRLQDEFETNGWCFIRLPDQNGQLIDKLDEVQKTLSTFFTQHQMEKLRHESSNAFGYSRVGHKEGIKILTDEHGLGNYHRPLTTDVEQTLQYLAVLLNDLITVLKSIILNMSILAVSPTKEMVPLSSLGMLDIVHYFNERTGPVEPPEIGLNTDEVNCVPHFDPGLFSLSILSTCDGLQLNDRLQNKWVDGPNNSEYDQRYIGVIWLGEAASILTENRFKSGIHRVVYPRRPHTSRLTIWQEVCTVAQIETLLPQDNVRSSDKLSNDFIKPFEHPSIQHNNFLPAGASVTMTNQPNSEPFLILSRDETLTGFMKQVEDKRGLSMSKSGIEHIQIQFPTKRNKASNPSAMKSFFARFFNW